MGDVIFTLGTFFIDAEIRKVDLREEGGIPYAVGRTLLDWKGTGSKRGVNESR